MFPRHWEDGAISGVCKILGDVGCEFWRDTDLGNEK